MFLACSPVSHEVLKYALPLPLQCPHMKGPMRLPCWPPQPLQAPCPLQPCPRPRATQQPTNLRDRSGRPAPKPCLISLRLHSLAHIPPLSQSPVIALSLHGGHARAFRRGSSSERRQSSLPLSTLRALVDGSPPTMRCNQCVRYHVSAPEGVLAGSLRTSAWTISPCREDAKRFMERVRVFFLVSLQKA